MTALERTARLGTLRCVFGSVLLFTSLTIPLSAQTSGSIVGRVVDDRTGEAIAGAEVHLEGEARFRTLTAEGGRFVLAAVPSGEHALVVERIGYRKLTLSGVPVRVGRASELEVRLTPAAISMEGIVVKAERVRLIEPQVAESRSVLGGEELRALPIDDIAQAVDLAPGVSQGHFRGGRIGQEAYLVDGIEVKNQLEASRAGPGIEFSPGAIEEVEVVTGGFGAEYGSALSGVVSYVTRRGNAERWEGGARVSTDQWAPESLMTGFLGVGASAGGPLRFLGHGATLFVDLLAQGYLDSDPRARGLTCLSASDARGDLATEIDQLRGGAESSLYCPYSGAMLPNQQGDKLIGFVRLDRPLPGDAALSLTLLRNRRQSLLYTPEYKYNADYQAGQRANATLGTASIDWLRHREGGAFHLTLRGAAMRLDRYLGAVDLATLADRGELGGIGLSAFEFVGEDAVRRPIAEQLASPEPIPGYIAPGGVTGSPFGPAGAGIFYTRGTPDFAAWNRMDMASGDLVGEWSWATGNQLRAGGSGKFYRVESYERVLAHLPVSALQYAEFFPASASGFAEARIVTFDQLKIEGGLRVEAFRSGLSFRPNRDDFLSPVLETSWHTSIMPRFAAAMPIPGTRERSAMRFNYGVVSQPPDFRYFLDSSIGDSLRTDIQRQGNPNIAFERGTSYEAAISHLVNDRVGAQLTVFYKQLRNLAAGAMGLAEAGRSRSSLRDFGHVRGLELSVRAELPPWLTLQAGYALQKAMGVASGSESDSLATDDQRIEYPLAFDRRHSLDLAIFARPPAGTPGGGWSGALTASVQSGYPVVRSGSDTILNQLEARYMPWTSVVGMRLSRDFASLPGCAGCHWRVVLDGRNLLGLDNVVGVRRETGSVAPRLADVERMAAMPPGDFTEIPREDPRYSAVIDVDADGLISASEFRSARFAAALDRYDPSLFYGEARQLRLGVEVAF